MATKPMSLYHLNRSELTLQEALNQYAEYLPGATALLYSPEDCQFALLTETTLNSATGEIPPAKLSRVFEARIFNGIYELRWLNEKWGTGTAVLLWDCEDSKAAKEADANPLLAIHTTEKTYILWGIGTKTLMVAGWSRLAAARIGKLDVPVHKVAENQRVCLRTREYFQAEKNYGNVTVVEERLMTLELVNWEKSA